MTTPEQNIEIANNFAKVFSTGDVDAILDCLHPDATYWVSGQIEGMSGTYDKKRLGELLRGVTSIYKEGALQITPTGAVAQGDRVAVEAESYAELNNGRVYKNQYHFLFEIADGKIIHVKEYMDTKHAYDIFYS
ncbi:MULTISPECIES: nuclear transport factor 2 family protein [Rhodococcus]|uniref:Nuclear transport factor 2 family protein n=1 Tax=Rhodococcus oxybenzonivorans TaxID=1990687 RepID=A0AAE5AA55_9NOCA|nr:MULTISPECIES: nuclear transport factor 2 family protein [Rhodococcus]MDV7245123.1 nuclear transport factor 2 family protein [Rhodococcus oxybenzonivorans]MDV7268479.1 nuclear transport factor 2 family protein [Rhodococcus oxybenzonivorans]MDV7272594.1 nuclear transport factor 2 family protein [Rhodococcus oxybenzonivorans]MDV7336148.1 nuclear transport factor 2 family protein [Rhodococcus oxybenzonivorans]MDV7342834.1 nuclear transport factor 2 family protein [Rhodococcus oxybenzonivorans]